MTPCCPRKSWHRIAELGIILFDLGEAILTAVQLRRRVERPSGVSRSSAAPAI